MKHSTVCVFDTKNVFKIFCGNNYNEIKNANSFWLVLPIVVRQVLIDSLGHAESIYTK